MSLLTTLVHILLIVMAIAVVIDRHHLRIEYEREHRLLRDRVRKTLDKYERAIEDYNRDAGPLTQAINEAMFMASELKDDLERAE